MNVYYFHHQADELLGTASEQFLGKSTKEIKQTILQTLEGHLRAILGKFFFRQFHSGNIHFNVTKFHLLSHTNHFSDEVCLTWCRSSCFCLSDIYFDT